VTSPPSEAAAATAPTAARTSAIVEQDHTRMNALAKHPVNYVRGHEGRHVDCA
jgi:hypothetical protein